MVPPRVRADRIERFDHRASDLAGYDPVTFGVADSQALDDWIAHLDRERADLGQHDL